MVITAHNDQIPRTRVPSSSNHSFLAWCSVWLDCLSFQIPGVNSSSIHGSYSRLSCDHNDTRYFWKCSHGVFIMDVNTIVSLLLLLSTNELLLVCVMCINEIFYKNLKKHVICGCGPAYKWQIQITRRNSRKCAVQLRSPFSLEPPIWRSYNSKLCSSKTR